MLGNKIVAVFLLFCLYLEHTNKESPHAPTSIIIIIFYSGIKFILLNYLYFLNLLLQNKYIVLMDSKYRFDDGVISNDFQLWHTHCMHFFAVSVHAIWITQRELIFSCPSHVPKLNRWSEWTIRPSFMSNYHILWLL